MQNKETQFGIIGQRAPELSDDIFVIFNPFEITQTLTLKCGALPQLNRHLKEQEQKHAIKAGMLRYQKLRR